MAIVRRDGAKARSVNDGLLKIRESPLAQDWLQSGTPIPVPHSEKRRSLSYARKDSAPLGLVKMMSDVDEEAELDPPPVPTTDRNRTREYDDVYMTGMRAEHQGTPGEKRRIDRAGHTPAAGQPAPHGKTSLTTSHGTPSNRRGLQQW